MLKSFYKFLCLYPPRDFKLPVFSIVSAKKDRLATIGVEWDKFSQEVYICCSNPNFSYRKIGDFVWVEISGERINHFPPSAKKSANVGPIPSGPPSLLPICPKNDEKSLFGRTGHPSKRRRGRVLMMRIIIKSHRKRNKFFQFLFFDVNLRTLPVFRLFPFLKYFSFSL